MLRSRHLTALSLATLALTAGAASAKTIEVPDDYQTITDAVKYAQAGDKIEIDSGTYFETFYIASNKPGLKLVGKGKVIIDAHPSQAPSGSAIRIYANDVEIENLTIRHLRNGSDGIYVAAHGASIEDVMFQDCTDAAIYVNASFNDLKVEDCGFIGCKYGVGLNAGGSVTVRDSEFSRVTHAVRASYATVKVEDCEFDLCGAPVYVSNGQATVRDNEIFNSSSKAIDLVYCPKVAVKGNEIKGGMNHGIVVYGVSSGKVEKNEVRLVANAGIYLYGSSTLKLDDNELLKCGTGLWIQGSSNSIRDNKVRSCTQNGVHVDGSNNVIADNSIKNCLKDGIWFKSGSNNGAYDNTVEKNGGEGLCNSGSNTTWDDNTAKGNRIDLANEGSVHATKNSYKTGGLNTKPQIKD